MKHFDQQNTPEGRSHVSNVGHQMQSGRDSLGMGQCGQRSSIKREHKTPMNLLLGRFVDHKQGGYGTNRDEYS